MRNTKLVYVITFLSECYWPWVVFIFFYLRYFSFAEIVTLTAIQMAATNLLEVPMGAFADLVGRKISIVLSFVIGAITLFIFPFATAFWVFAILEMVKGLSNALYSGSMEALVYDDMKEQGQETHYPQVIANIETITWIGWFVSSIVGGYLYYSYLPSPWLLQGSMFVGAAILAWKLVEPRIDSVKVNLRSVVKQNIEGFRELFRTARIGRITLQLTIIGAGYIIASGILGPSQAREYGMDARGAGWLYGIGCLLSVIASRLFPKLRQMLGEKTLVVTTTSILLISFLAARYVGVIMGSALIVLRIASSSTFRNTRSVVVNEWISSKNRATALSTLNLLSQTPYILLSPLLGGMIDKSSPNQFSWVLGIGIVGLLLILSLIPNRRVL